MWLSTVYFDDLLFCYSIISHKKKEAFILPLFQYLFFIFCVWFRFVLLFFCFDIKKKVINFFLSHLAALRSRTSLAFSCIFIIIPSFVLNIKKTYLFQTLAVQYYSHFLKVVVQQKDSAHFQCLQAFLHCLSLLYLLRSGLR